MNAETQRAFDEFHAAFSPLVRSIGEKARALHENAKLIENLPLSERLLAWSEWNRLCRPPLTGTTLNPHADDA